MAKIKRPFEPPTPAREIPSSLSRLSEKTEHSFVSYDYRVASKERQFSVEVTETDVAPCIVVTVPDEWPHVKIAPLYDVHLGSKELDGKKLVRDIRWLADEPYTLTWNGGDLWDNAIKSSIASSFSNDSTPNEQFNLALDVLKTLLPKVMFALPGNHEQRTGRTADLDVAKLLNDQMGIPYSPDYMICTVKWRNNKFRILAHHGTGAAASPGGQRNAARKDMAWAHGLDLYWTGHLHQPLTDLVSVLYFNQASDRPLIKEVYSVISPSYVRYFGGYAAVKRLAPGARGLTVATLREDGRMDIENHANGKRL